MRWPSFARAKPASPERCDWIAEDAWHALVASQPFVERLADDERARLRGLCGAFLATKAINGAGGLVLTDAMVASIATQACLPILALGLAAYPSFEEIIVYPDDFVVDREIIDDDGVVHEWSEPIAGESWDGGPVVLAWHATTQRAKGRRPSPFAFNVVIHEFAHKLDMANGAVDGIPAFTRTSHPSLKASAWLLVLEASLEDFRVRVDEAEASIPRHVDPESARADRYYEGLPLDPYAGDDEGEFFSVTSEAFFVAPTRLRTAYPDWYGLLAAFYRQDPIGRA